LFDLGSFFKIITDILVIFLAIYYNTIYTLILAKHGLR
jgi:hypothetical protein